MTPAGVSSKRMPTLLSLDAAAAGLPPSRVESATITAPVRPRGFMKSLGQISNHKVVLPGLSEGTGEVIRYDYKHIILSLPQTPSERPFNSMYTYFNEFHFFIKIFTSY